MVSFGSPNPTTGVSTRRSVASGSNNQPSSCESPRTRTPKTPNAISQRSSSSRKTLSSQRLVDTNYQEVSPGSPVIKSKAAKIVNGISDEVQQGSKATEAQRLHSKDNNMAKETARDSEHGESGKSNSELTLSLGKNALALPESMMEASNTSRVPSGESGGRHMIQASTGNSAKRKIEETPNDDDDDVVFLSVKKAKVGNDNRDLYLSKGTIYYLKNIPVVEECVESNGSSMNQKEESSTAKDEPQPQVGSEKKEESNLDTENGLPDKTAKEYKCTFCGAKYEKAIPFHEHLTSMCAIHIRRSFNLFQRTCFSCGNHYPGKKVLEFMDHVSVCVSLGGMPIDEDLNNYPASNPAPSSSTSDKLSISDPPESTFIENSVSKVLLEEFIMYDVKVKVERLDDSQILAVKKRIQRGEELKLSRPKLSNGRVYVFGDGPKRLIISKLRTNATPSKKRNAGFLYTSLEPATTSVGKLRMKLRLKWDTYGRPRYPYC